MERRDHLCQMGKANPRQGAMESGSARVEGESHVGTAETLETMSQEFHASIVQV